jgi:DNA-directed RNA polymerase subunit K
MSGPPVASGRTKAATRIRPRPQTYINRSHFRGYLPEEDANLKFTRFERARIIGARALQISMGAPILVDIQDQLADPIGIAIIEYEKGVIPMTVKGET